MASVLIGVELVKDYYDISIRRNVAFNTTFMEYWGQILYNYQKVCSLATLLCNTDNKQSNKIITNKVITFNILHPQQG